MGRVRRVPGAERDDRRADPYATARSGVRSAERTHTPHAVMEAALAHTIRNQAEAAYARSDLFEKRRELMQSWAQYLGRETEG